MCQYVLQQYPCSHSVVIKKQKYLHIFLFPYFHSTFCPIRRFFILCFVPFGYFSIQHFVPFGVFPFDILSRSAFFPFDVFSIRCFVPFGLLSHSTLVPFDIWSHSAFFPFNVLSHSMFCLSTFCRSTFCPFGVCDFDILSVNQYFFFSYTGARRVCEKIPRLPVYRGSRGKKKLLFLKLRKCSKTSSKLSVANTVFRRRLGGGGLIHPLRLFPEK